MNEKEDELFAFLCVAPIWRDAREQHYAVDCGKYNGYVGFPKANFNPSFSLMDDERFEIHGGISFDGSFGPEKEIIPLTKIPIGWWNSQNYRIIGFDCCHGYEEECYLSFSLVSDMTIGLMEQVKNLIDEQLRLSNGE